MMQLFSRRSPDTSTDIKFIPINLDRTKTKHLGEIKPELYKKQITSDAPVENKNDGELCGKLYFALQYDRELDSLIVKLFGAADLPAKDMNGLCDPYVKIFLPPNKKKKFQTKVQMKNRNPVFNETFMFNVYYEDLRKKQVQFSVFDFDRFSKHDLIGHVIFKNLDELADLRQEVEYTMDIILPPNDQDQLGELNLCLCYLPTAGRLTITILKGHKLKAMDITGKSDPYVKVYMMCQGKKVKKRKTRIKHKTLNPIYNEALVFEVSEENIKDVCFVVLVVDYDRIGLNDLMGCLVIGPNVTEQETKEHWKEMLDKPRKPISRWYPLTESLPDDIPPLKDGSFISLSCIKTFFE